MTRSERAATVILSIFAAAMALAGVWLFVAAVCGDA